MMLYMTGADSGCDDVMNVMPNVFLNGALDV